MKTKKGFRLMSLTTAVMLTMITFAQRETNWVYAAANTQEILITEIMPMSQSTNDSYEYFELYNNSDRNIELKDYKLPLQNIDITSSKIISPKGILVICTNGSTTLESFNSFYGTTLTADKYMNLPFVNEILSNNIGGSILLSKDDGNIVARANYSTADFEAKKSVTYTYAQTGFDMVLLGQKQAPTAGSVTAEQIPDSGVRVTGITLDKSFMTLDINQSATISATISPATATNKSVVWRTSNSSIADVSTTGIVTTKAEGTVNITATTVDGGFSAVCTIVVSRVPVTGVSVDKSAITLEAGKGMILTATVLPQNATNKTVTWKSSNSNIAAVYPNGIVVGISAGEANITATTADGNYTAICKVTVTAVNGIVPVTGIRLDKSNITLIKGQAVILEGTVSPTNATNKEVVWTSSNNSVASVDIGNGVVIAKQQGTAVITATTKDGGYKAYCTITVNSDNPEVVAVSRVKLNYPVLFMNKGKETILTATVYPSNATNKSVTWSSDNTSVASVDSSGKVTALKKGFAVITVTTKDNNYTDKCFVVVSELESKCELAFALKLNKSSISIKEGKTEQIKAIITPANIKNVGLIWRSTNEKVAVVTSEGKITAKKEGTTEIIVTTKDGKYSARCKVTVIKDKDKGKGRSNK